MAADQLFGAKELLEHHLEHELASVGSHIESLVGKLEKREDVAEGRLKELETKITKVPPYLLSLMML